MKMRLLIININVLYANNQSDLIDFQMSPPYVPKVTNLKKFEECSQTKYILELLPKH